MNALGCLFAFVLGFLLLGMGLVVGAWRFVMNMLGGRKPQRRAPFDQPRRDNHAAPTAKAGRRKVIADDEGEYVDFEEIDDKGNNHSSAN